MVVMQNLTSIVCFVLDLLPYVNVQYNIPAVGLISFHVTHDCWGWVSQPVGGSLYS